MKNKRFILIYDLLFSVLALVAVYLSLCDLTTGCSSFQLTIDNIITWVFIIDYIMRIALAKDKRIFVKENILDLIAIIPFNSLFKVFRIFKLFKVLKAVKILKFARLSAYFGRFYKRVKFFFEINGLKYMVIASIFCIILGGVMIHFAENMSISDGIWWSFVTATTVGYGDISPATPFGRSIAAILMLVGIGLIGSLTSTITALFFHRNESKPSSTKDELIHTIHTQLDNFDNLSDQDIDTICTTLQSLHSSNQK